MKLSDKARHIYQLIDNLPTSGPDLKAYLNQTTWIEMAGGPYGGIYEGYEEIMSHVFSCLGSDWEGFRMTPEEFIESTERLVVVGEYTGIYKQTGNKLDVRVVHLWKEVDDGLVFEQFTDTACFFNAMHSTD